MSGQPIEVTKVLEEMLTFTSKDMAADRLDAWLYGIIIGWDDEDGDGLDAMSELAKRFGWSEVAVTRLRAQREAWKRLANAEATLARVEALRDKWGSHAPKYSMHAGLAANSLDNALKGGAS